MRWHVHGTDSVSGEDVELVVPCQEADQAVKIAIDKQIVVSHVTVDAKHSFRPVVTAFLFLTVIALAGVGIGQYVHNQGTRIKLDQAIKEQSRLAQSLVVAEDAAAEIRANGNLAEAAAQQMAKLANDLTAARSRMSLTEQQLSAAHRHMDELALAAARVTEVEAQVAALGMQLSAARGQLKESERIATQLRMELALQARRAEQLAKLPPPVNPAAEKLAKLEDANRALTAELAALREQLLVTVAKANAPAAPEVQEEDPPAHTSLPWALRVSYDGARNFMSLNTESSSVVTRPAQEGLLSTASVLTENALRLRFVHDREKERVYSATLTLSLAIDAPKDKVAANMKFIGDFLREFVPGIKDADALAAAAVAQQAGLGEDRRALFMVQDCKVTAWNNKSGLYTFHIETAHDLLH